MTKQRTVNRILTTKKLTFTLLFSETEKAIITN